MMENKVKLSTVVKNQLPQFVTDNYPLFVEFLSSYYESQEYVGSPIDILTNIDQYLKPENLRNVSRSTALIISVDNTSSTITVSSTEGFPESYGMIQIDDEIITYKSKSSTEFRECIRGLSGISSWNADGSFVFSDTESQNHVAGAEIKNLSVLFLDILFSKLKKQFLPGFDNNLDDTINQSNFLKHSKDFYKSKGTDTSFKILFKALFGEDVKVIKPSDYLFKPSNSFNKVTKSIVVESLEGDPTQLVNRTLYQDQYLGQDIDTPNYGINKSYGTVSGVEKIFLENNEYYIINIDSGYYRDITVDGTVYGDFVAHPKTKLIGTIAPSFLSNSVIDVDSTLGFPNSGFLIINGLRYSYDGKSVNQFYNLDGGDLSTNLPDGSDVYLDVYAYGETKIGLKDIKVRITPIISELKIIEDTYYMSSEDTAKIKSLGYESENNKANNWLFNHSLSYDVKEVRRGNTLDLYDNHSFFVGDKIKIYDNFGVVIPSANITSVDDSNTIVISANVPLIRGRSYRIERQILKNDINPEFSDLEKYSTNVQNTYVKSYNDDVLVASSSIPFYWDSGNIILNPNKKRVSFWSFGNPIGNPSVGIGTDLIPLTRDRTDHGFYTGDAVYYTPYSVLESTQQFNDDFINANLATENYDLILETSGLSLSQGVYYVKRINSNTIKLSNSLSDLYKNKYIKVYANIPESFKNIFEYYGFYNKSLQPQNIVREIKKPVESSIKNKTLPGTTGIFINGVELLNYKSTDSVYYGEIENILVTSPGFGYDVINPPDVLISDNVGFGATAVCSVTGSLERIEIIDPGFDYIDDPIIRITGGNGSNASAKAEMKMVSGIANFNSILGVNTVTNTIGFSTYHKFRQSEKVTYRSNGQKGVVGLVTNSNYYVSLVDFNNIKLHRSLSDANLGINTISLNFGDGTHFFETTQSKKVISRIVVENPGQNYQNKKRIVSLSGINTASNSFYIKEHGYKTRETIVYSTTGSEIGGLSTTAKYIVTKIDDDNFKLSISGENLNLKYDNFEKNKYVNITGFGSGIHSFNYEPIEVSIIGSLNTFPSPLIPVRQNLPPAAPGQPQQPQQVNTPVTFNISVIPDGTNFALPDNGGSAPLSMVGNNPLGQQYIGAQNRNPAVSWSIIGLPQNVSVSNYSIHLEDISPPDGAPNTPIIHWSITNIPSNITSIPANANIGNIGGGNINDNYLGNVNVAGVNPVGYAGPQPPNERHTYRLTVIAALTGSVSVLRKSIEFIFDPASNQIATVIAPTHRDNNIVVTNPPVVQQVPPLINDVVIIENTVVVTEAPLQVPTRLVTQTFGAKIQPIFRGSIDSVNLVSVGSSYGTPDILNYNRSPLVEFSRGTNAEVLPVVNNGKIVEVLVLNSGSGYKSVPNLIVTGSGSYEQLTPIIEDGKLIEVKVINGGIGFKESDTRIAVSSPGEGCRVETNIKKWTVNLFEKNKSLISSDDGFLNPSIDSELGLQYCHLYTPRKLREIVPVKNSDGDLLYGVSDLAQNLSGNEVQSSYHSPILGWAHDGCPIYGPYAYENPNGSGNIVQMRSGYTKKTNLEDRPTISPDLGFFIEDYEFTNSGTLDENNGRFCVTPEYPNGTYAYFTTLSLITNLDTPFREYKTPEFPYVIGNYFKFLPNKFNFDKNSNQNNFNLNKTDWFRNTTPYILKNKNSKYNYIFDPNAIKICDSEITFSSKGKINDVIITSGGSGYKVNDEIIFEEPPTFTYPSSAKVTKISGKTINSIGLVTSIIRDVEFTSFSDKEYVGYSSSPHSLKNDNYITISGVNTSFKNIQKTFKIKVPNNVLQLTVGVGSTGSTGIITYFNVSGDLSFDKIRENDVLGIGTELVKVLNVDQRTSRIKVIRSFNSSVGSSHSVSEKLVEIPRKFYIDLNSKGTNPYSKNKEYYFNPIESLGIGNTFGVGIGTTIFFSNPGIGITQIFIPTKSIFLEKHNFNSGDELIYSHEDGSPIRVSNGSSTFDLQNNQSVYALKITNNLVGLCTLSSPLDINNSLFFVGVGSGELHKFRTLYPNSLYAEIERHTATVSLASSHNLKVNDTVFLNVFPSTEKTVIVEYNDFNRRLVVNPRQFVATGVNPDNNTITINNHGYKNGEKIIHVSTVPCVGLEDNGIYYVNVKNKDTISLSKDLYDSNLSMPIEVNINSQSFGTIYQINPNLEVSKNETIKFDLSHQSLSFVYSSTRYSSFDFKLYKDPNFIFEFLSSSQTNNFEVIKSGATGIDSTSNVQLKIRDGVPKTLYYTLSPSNNPFLPEVKKNIVIDDELERHNQITIVDNIFGGEKTVLGIGSTTFQYDLSGISESILYNSSNASLSYDTSSLSEDGSIKEIKIINSNDKYEIVPKISTIKTLNGKDAIIDATSKSIGKVKSSKIINNGFDFASDNTIRPFTIIPYTLKILPLSSFDRIDVVSPGRNYNVSPDLIVKDSFTNQIVDDVLLSYELGNPNVKIVKNTSGFYNVLPKIIPINNSNGVGIHSISYNLSTKNATVTLSSSFSTGYFPFALGDKVLIENVSIVGVDTEGKGYNSENYNYDLFEVTSINPNFGGFGATVTFNMSKFLSSTEIPGTYNPNIPLGRIIPEKEFPVFRTTLKKNNFIIGEPIEIQNSSVTGIVEKWNPNTEFLKVSTDRVIRNADIVVGKTSKTKGFVRNVYHFISEYILGASAIVNYGNQDDSGFLNVSTQRLHDNHYYQQFSYSLNSKQNLNEWSEIVDSLNHTSGFIKFSDLLVESLPEGTQFWPKSRTNDEADINCIVQPVQNTVDVLNDIINVIDLESVPYFDIVTENKVSLRSRVLSNRIKFKTRDLSDYFESVGNRVLSIDNISTQFNKDPRPTAFSSIDVFDLSYASKKYFVYIKDKTFYDERQLSIVSLLHDGTNAYLNQYGRVETQDDLGYFDFRVFGSGGQLLFFPTKFTVNDYDISFVSYDLKKNISTGSTILLGNISKIESSSKFSSIPSTIVGLSSNQRCAKIIVQHHDQNDNREFDEISIIHDGTNVQMLEYGQLTDISRNSFSSPGLGTYHAYISGSNFNLDFYPNPGLAITTNTLTVSMSNNLFVTNGDYVLGDISSFRSFYANIPSSPSSFDTVIGSYFIGTSFNTFGAYDAAYFIVSIEDLTNNEYQMSEVLVVNDFNVGVSRVNFVEYGSLYTNNPLGIISCRQNIDKIELLFNQKPNANIQVRTFKNCFKLKQQETSIPEVIDLNNSRIITSDANYQGTDSLVKYSFNLTHDQNELFQRQFVGNSTSIVDIQNNFIRIPNHYFSTGEKLTYSVLSNGGSPIGIATTTITGIGQTTLLPSTVYAIKLNESLIRLASSAENALKALPISFDFTSVGIGSAHILRSEENKNSRVLISIDNVIQSPLVSTGVSERLLNNISISEKRLTLSGITSFVALDLIKIDNEIMRIESVGFGSTNVILVNRPWMGTGVSTHSSGSSVTKLKGSYNIVNNYIHFSEPPRGLTPSVANDFKSVFNINYNSVTGLTTVTTVFENDFNVNDQIVVAGSSVASFNGYYKVISTDNIRNFVIQLPPGIVGIPSGDLYVYNPLSSTSPDERDWSGISSSSKFHGRLFMKSGVLNTNNSTYFNNYIFDDISNDFNAINRSFNLTSNGQIINGISTSNAIILVNNIFQGPQSLLDTPQNYELKENSGITSITFIGAATSSSYDPNNASIPIGGVIVSVGSTNGLGYQPLVSAGGTAIISIAGTIQSISIGNSGSGYRSGIQTTVNVSVAHTALNVGVSSLTRIGIASISNGNVISVSITNPGSGYTLSNPPVIVFDEPLSYSNIPLIYSSSSTSGVGTEATVNIIVGQGSSVINFEINKLGYGYKLGDVLTVSTSSVTGIPTISSIPFQEFRLTIDKVHKDDFTGWFVGDLIVLDEINNLFDGTRTEFPLSVDGNLIAIKSRPGSNIDVKSTLLVFINDVLQVPGEGYIFEGGSLITFTEPLKPDQPGITNSGDRCRILFYRGNGDNDVLLKDIIETVKVGDGLTILENENTCKNSTDQNQRIVYSIPSTDLTDTNVYTGPGINDNLNCLRGVTWSRQREDKVINGNIVGKDRIMFEPVINPLSNIIQPVSTSSTVVYVQNLKTFFDSKKEDIDLTVQKKLALISQKNVQTAICTAFISSSGIVTGISIIDGGSGYTSNPEISIESPSGITTNKATAIASISSGIVTNITITNSGVGYTYAPSILIQSPIVNVENLTASSFIGDFGKVVGIATTSIVGVTTGLNFDLFIPNDSVLISTSIVGTAITLSTLQVGDFFTVYNTNVGNSVTSLYTNGNVLGVGTQYLDNVYQVSGISSIPTSVPGYGITHVSRVTVSVLDFNGFSGIGSTSMGGEYSWGKVNLNPRIDPKEFFSYNTNGVSGIKTSDILIRTSSLKYAEYKR